MSKRIVARRAIGRARPWSFLVYIAGDNNLSEAGLRDIREMCRHGSTPDVHVAVQIDTKGEFEGVVRYEITPIDPLSGEAHRTVIERLPESDSGAPEILLDFLKWGFRRYPAKRQVVVVWNHGTGFRTGDARRNIAYDDSGTSLDMNEVDRVFDLAGIGPDNRVSILGFDACLMCMLEIAHHLRKRAEYLVGSQQTEPNDGWPYADVLRQIQDAGNSVNSAELAACGIVDRYIEHYKSINRLNVTQSAILTDATETAIDDLGALGHALQNALEKYALGITLARRRTQAYDFPDYVDLVDLCVNLSEATDDKSVAIAAKALAASAKQAVTHSGFLGTGVKRSHGLSVWFPSTAELYARFRPKYVALDFASRSHGWVKFLDMYHA